MLHFLCFYSGQVSFKVHSNQGKKDNYPFARPSWFLEAPVAPTSLKFTKKTWKNKLKLTDQNMDQIQHCEMVAG